MGLIYDQWCKVIM